jgi:hypothetical protein
MFCGKEEVVVKARILFPLSIPFGNTCIYTCIKVPLWVKLLQGLHNIPLAHIFCYVRLQLKHDNALKRGQKHLTQSLTMFLPAILGLDIFHSNTMLADDERGQEKQPNFQLLATHTVS